MKRAGARTLVPILMLVLSPLAGRPAWGGQSLQARIDAAPAGGEILVTGHQTGGIVIRKPLRLTGAPGAVIDAGGTGTVVRIESPGVTISRLVLRGSGTDLNTEDAGVFIGASHAVLEDVTLEDVLFGANLKQAHDAILRRVAMSGKDLPLSRRGDAVRLWYSHRVALIDLRVRMMRDVLIWFSDGSVIQRADVRASRYGVHLMYANSMRIMDSFFDGNAVGAYVMYSTGVEMEGNRIIRHRDETGVGLALKESEGITLRRNLIASNRVGLYVDGTPRANGRSEIAGNVIAGNDTGMMLLTSASGNVITANMWIGNTDQIFVAGGASAQNIWQQGGTGNYWSDYAGLDGTGDGVGDTPYRSWQWYEGLTARYPEIQILEGSMAAAAIDNAARLLPAFAPRLLVEDARPLVRPRIPAEFQVVERSPELGSASGMLILIGLLALRKPGSRRWRT